MNIEKANLKVLVATDIGASIEDRMEAEQKAAVELEGGSKSLAAAAKKIPVDLCAKVDVAVEEGAITDGMTALEVAEVVKNWLTRAGAFLVHLSDVAKQRSVHQYARAEGLKDAMEAVAKMRATEIAKIDGFTRLVEQEEDESPPLPSVPPVASTSSDPAATRPRTSSEVARAQRGSVADRRTAEDAARTQHGSAADRRAAAVAQKEQVAEVEVHHKPPPKTVRTEAAPRGKPENVKKRPQKAARKRGATKKKR